MDSPTLISSILSSPLTAAALAGIGIAYRDHRKDKRETKAEVKRVADLERQRDWDREDREEKARLVAAKLEAHAETLAKATDAQTGAVLAAVEDGKQKTSEFAFTANGYNEKIANLYAIVAGLDRRMAGFEAADYAQAARLQAIEAVLVSINRHLQIKEK